MHNPNRLTSSWPYGLRFAIAVSRPSCDGLRTRTAQAGHVGYPEVMSFKDMFSHDSASYAANRPTYPDVLFDHVSALVESRTCAWDCATGSGQAARQWAKHFERVVASDASRQQLRHAVSAANIRYLASTAEDVALADDSVDLICVAQALHWFDHPRFYDECRRVARPNAVVVAWTYLMLRTNTVVDEVIDEFYAQTDRYWSPERDHVDAAYTTIPWPFQRLECDDFTIESSVTLDSLVAYVCTWSALRTMRQQTGVDPIPDFRRRLESTWPGPSQLPTTTRVPVLLGRIS